MLVFLDSFNNTAGAVIQVLLLGGIGFFLIKKRIISEEGLNTLSKLLVEFTLPVLIFCQLIKGFSFSIYPNWWVFPLISMAITLAGLGVATIFLRTIKDREKKIQFLSLVSFQNSGYLPLALISTLPVRGNAADTMFIYLFLFLLGFNLVLWSAGVYLLTAKRTERFELGSLFSPPVIATLVSLLIIFLKLQYVVPAGAVKSLKTLGDCTVPLAMLIVGGNLAMVRLRNVDVKAVSMIVLLKNLLLPGLGILLVSWLKLPYLIGLLVVLELCMPPATSLSVIIRHYKKDDLLISQGIFFGHLASVITIPLFLSLYFTSYMIQ